MDPDERLELLDAEGIDAVVLYTTVGLLWEAELDDPELSQAYTRAYNRWICEFCAGSDRLVPDRPPVARRSRGRGRASSSGRSARAPRAPTSRPFTHDGRPLGHPDNDPVFAAAQDLGVPFAIHPTFEPQWTKGTRMGAWENVRQLRLLASVTASDGVRHQFTTLFDYGVFDRFPELEGARPRVGRRLDRLLARPHRRRLRPHVHRHAGAARAQAERLLPRAGVDLVRPRRAHDPARWPSGSAPTGSSGRRTSRTPTTRPSTSPTSRSWPAAFPDEATARAFLGDNARALFDIPASAVAAS